MGRHKKPVELKIIQGNPGKRKLPKIKNLRTDENFLPSFELDDHAQEYFNHFHDILKEQGVLKSSDIMELTMLAYYSGKFKEVTEMLKGQNFSCMSDKGNEYQNPLWGLLNTFQDKIQKMLIQFGMTPVARDAVFNKIEETENTFLEIL